jgi:hypothetical protein
MARACLCGILLGSMCLLHTVSGQTAQHPSEGTSELVEQFKTTTTFWKQFEVAKQFVALHDKSVLQDLQLWLSNEDMHQRASTAFIFASLDDDRGFQVINAILENRSPKRAVFRIDDAGWLSNVQAEECFGPRPLPADPYSLSPLPVISFFGPRNPIFKERHPWNGPPRSTKKLN